MSSAVDDAVRSVQFLSVDAVEKAQSGHPGTPMALAEIAVDLFSRHLRWVPEDPGWPNRDRFVLSCGHASMLLYSILHLAGYAVSLDDIRAFRQWGSITPGHPEHGTTPGVETTTGPLGQGFCNAVGMALASKMMAARVNAPGCALIDYRVFVLASDGDLMEGVASEAASLAGYWTLDNLVVVYDDNRITIDGSTELTFNENVGQRFEAYGWYVQHIDGHDREQIRAALDRAAAEGKRPSLIIARTHIAIGAPTKQDTADAHGAPLGAAEVEGTKRAAGWPLEAFHVAPRAREPFTERAEQNRADRAAWQASLGRASSAQKALFEQLSSRAVPEDVFAELIAVAPSKPDATRAHAGKIEQRIAELVPSLIGGSADLASSVKTTIGGGGDVRGGEYAGKNLHFGVREHAMASISNGLALSGFFLPFASTFLIFSDYMRPAIRLAALMEQQVVYVYSHDSVFVGEDGPTHQPIEQLWTLRLVPNLDVFRPADSLECAAAWAHALRRRRGPTVLSLTRQKVPSIERPPGFDPRVILDGAYVLSDTPSPDLVLIATGSEVHVALEAKKILEQRGKRVRVVSAPCLEAFERLPIERQRAVLGEGIRRVTLEVGSSRPWRALAGPDGICLGVDHFGSSAPWQRIAEELGFTGEKVAAAILAAL
jgi:transketolase